MLQLQVVIFVVSSGLLLLLLSGGEPAAASPTAAIRHGSASKRGTRAAEAAAPPSGPATSSPAQARFEIDIFCGDVSDGCATSDDCCGKLECISVCMHATVHINKV